MAEVFGQRLRDMRLACGYSRRELAEGAGLSESAVRDYEQGKRSPSLEAAARLAVALGKSLSVWDGCLGMTTGAYRLPPRPTRAGALKFGQYKGRLPAEVPTGYLEWMVRERPSQASAAELEAARRQLHERDRDRRIAEAEEREAARAATIAADQARRAARDGRQTELAAAQEEAAVAQKELAAAQARCRELEDRAQRLREEAIRPTPPAKPAPKTKLDDALPWENTDDPGESQP